MVVSSVKDKKKGGASVKSAGKSAFDMNEGGAGAFMARNLIRSNPMQGSQQKKTKGRIASARGGILTIDEFNALTQETDGAKAKAVAQVTDEAVAVGFAEAAKAVDEAKAVAAKAVAANLEIKKNIESHVYDKLLFIMKIMKDDTLSAFNKAYIENKGKSINTLISSPKLTTKFPILQESKEKFFYDYINDTIQIEDLQNTLPSYDLLHTIIRLLQVTKKMTHLEKSSSQLGGGYRVMSAKKYNKLTTKQKGGDDELIRDKSQGSDEVTILSAIFKGNDDSEDENYDPLSDIEGLLDFQAENINAPDEITNTLVELTSQRQADQNRPSQRDQSNVMNYLKYFAIFITLLLTTILGRYASMQNQSFYVDPIVASKTGDHSSPPNMLPFTVTSYETTLDPNATSENLFGFKTNLTGKPLTITLHQPAIPTQAMTTVDYFTQYIEPSYYNSSAPAPSCMLLSKPESALSMRHQLFAHKENLMEYYIEMIAFIQKNKPDIVIIEEMKQSINTGIRDLFTNIEQPPDKPKPKAINYIELVENELLPSLIQNFNAFATKPYDIPNFFATLRSLNSYHKASHYFKSRMAAFERILIDHFNRTGKSLEFSEFSPACNNAFTKQGNKIIIPLRHYQQGLLFDLRMNYQDIARRQVKLYGDFKPTLYAIITEAFKENPKPGQILETIKTQHGTLFANNPDLAIIIAILKNEGTDETKMKQVTDHLKKTNNRFAAEMEFLEKHKEWSEWLSATTGNVVDMSGVAVNNIFRGLMAFGEGAGVLEKGVRDKILDFGMKKGVETAESVTGIFADVKSDIETVKNVAVSATNDLANRVTPNFILSLGDVMKHVVTNMEKATLTSRDRDILTQVAITQLSGIMQKMFHSTQFLETLNNDVSKMVPFYKTMSNALRSAYKNYKANTNEAYIQMSGGAMQLLNAEVTIRRKRIEKWVLVSQVDIIKLLYKSAKNSKDNLLNLFGSEIIGLTQNIAKDHIQLNLEIEERELAMILLHFQNDIIRGPESKNEPSYEIKLASYPDFLNKYHLTDEGYNGFSKYFSVIAIKMLNIMLLNFISNTPVGAGFALGAHGGGRRKNKKQIGGGIQKLSSKSKSRPSSSVKTIGGGSGIVPKKRPSSSSVSLSKRK